MPKHLCVLAAAVMLLNGAAATHSWYDEKCCHDKDCHPVPWKKIEKIRDGCLWRDVATKQRPCFPHGRWHASHDDACHFCFSPLTRPSGFCFYVPLPA